MGMVQKYKTLAVTNTTGVVVILAPPGTNGILMGITVHWWPQTRATSGSAEEGGIKFYLGDGQAPGKEVLGTDQANEHSPLVKEDDQVFLWVHDREEEILWLTEWLSKFKVDAAKDFQGLFVNGLSLVAKLTDAQVLHNLAIGVQYMEFD